MVIDIIRNGINSILTSHCDMISGDPDSSVQLGKHILPHRVCVCTGCQVPSCLFGAEGFLYA